MTVHGMTAPNLDDPEVVARERMRSGRLKMLLMFAICAAPVIASYVTYFVIRPAGRTNYGTLIQPTRSLPELALRTLDGAPVPVASLRGQWLLIAVGPANCVDDCDRRLFMQRQLREMMGKDSDRVEKVWFVTDDAAPPSALRAAIAKPPALQALRVDRTALARWLEPAPGAVLEDHLYIVDPMGQWMMREPAHPDPMKVKRDLERLLQASAGWDRAGR